ncbi:MAG TPA: phosphotransferase [Solirubrobacteraceae bacterium]
MSDLERVLAQVPELRAAGDRSVTPIEGGMTNRNCRVKTGSGDYVVRIAATESGELGIDRDNEYENSVRAWRAGVGVGVVARVREPEALVVEFVDGRTLAPADFADERRVSVLAGLLRRLHGCEPFERDFDMVLVQRRYLEIVTSRGYPLPEDYAAYADRARTMGEVLAATRTATAPCHNDLMPGNFIQSGGPGGRMWLIDYEYSGNNDPCYDLGDAINELELDRSRIEQLVTEYHGGPNPRELARARLASLQSKYGWSLWGSIRIGTTGDPEIIEWARALWTRARAEFDSPEFAELIERAGSTGPMSAGVDLSRILGRLEPMLGPRAGQPAPLEGGITNRNYRVRLGEVDYMIRLPGKDTSLLGIDRTAERVANEAAAGLGIAPAVAAAGEDYLVTRFIECRPVSASELAGDPTDVAGALRAFHDHGHSLPTRFWVPELLADYARIVQERGRSLPDGFEHARRTAERIAAARPLTDPVSCHNDLLTANLIRDRDGRLLLVDWEYAGMGDPYFDLGNLSVNNEFDEHADDRLLSAYLGHPPDRAATAALHLMRAMSDVREATWGVVQGAISELDFDFGGYAEKHFARLRAITSDPRFEESLHAASP